MVLIVIPVFNERDSTGEIFRKIRKFGYPVLFVDDGSRDGSSDLIRQFTEDENCYYIRHEENRGYGAALISGFDFALKNNYEFLLTIDCDGQHNPEDIPAFIENIRGYDLVSGSRYLFKTDISSVPEERYRINRIITKNINSVTVYDLTDAFCGFKLYRTGKLKGLVFNETGYGFPLEFWIRASENGLRIREVFIEPRYPDRQRKFGGRYDDPEYRLRYYLNVIKKAQNYTGVKND